MYNKCLHQLFEEQVEQTPNGVAVIFEGQQLTYQQLNNKANQLAHHLHFLGIKPEILVGICVERSIEMIIGILAIIKAGGAYVPLDPSYPKERLDFLLSDSKISTLLTQEKFRSYFSEFQLRLICLDTDWKNFASESRTNITSNVQSKNMVYMFYTSGSTGKPKGVMVTHFGSCQGLLWLQEAYQLHEQDRILQKTSFSFDISVWEYFWPLIMGAGVVIAKPDEHQNNIYLIKLITKEQVTIVFFVPSVLQIFLAEQSLENCNSLRRIFSVGEALSFDLQKRFFTYLPNCELHDIYGSTENFAVTYWHCKPDENPRMAPIGRIISGVQTYILDSHLKQVPIGEIGELYVSSTFLARGYFNRIELTADKFIQNPFLKLSKHNRNDNNFDILYKTGDLARYRVDGDIEHLGRSDHQIKIHGLRVELGEIEAVLTQYQGVQQAVIVVWGTNQNNKHLVAYIVPHQDYAITSSELQHFLEENIPNYMVPSVFVQITKMPLTPNGKIDRYSLSIKNPFQNNKSKKLVKPRNQTEERLVTILANLLKHEQIDIHDNFFELGGNSLLTIKMLSQIQYSFDKNLPVQDFLKNPTVAGVAQILETVGHTNTSFEGMTVAKLQANATLDKNIIPTEKITLQNKEPDAIFLTGVTGFLGAFLLDELLSQTQAKIYCLVRHCNTITEGQQKIQKNLERYKLLKKGKTLNYRIIPVNGDLSQPFLGLDKKQFNQLSNTIDIIYHSAALVNLLYPYSAMRATNVQGTQNILRLATQNRLKHIHYISTLGVFESKGYSTRKKKIFELDKLDDCEFVYGGYAQSKWVAEKMVEIAKSRGIPITIYRPNMISGHSKTGISNTDDLVCRLLKHFIYSGYAPNINITIDMTPVDYVSQAIVHLSRQKEYQGKIFHLCNTQSLHLNQLLKEIRVLGYPIEQIEYAQWVSKQKEYIKDQESNFSAMLLALTENISNTQLSYLEMSSFGLSFDCENTLRGLANTSIVCPPINTELLGVYFSYFTSSGFLS